jgi:hypothetical protein
VKYDDIEEADLYNVLPAFSYVIKTLSEHVPAARIVLIINDGLKKELTEGMKEVADHFKIERVDLEGIDKMSDHPTALGMKQIKEQVLKKLT